MSAARHREQRGFTLIEAIMVITLTGIIAAVIAVFIRKPVDAYFDTVRRAELTDAADIAVRRIGREIALALPNSVRVTESGGVAYIEFIMTSGGGRYRDDGDGSTGGNILDFNTASLNFDVLGAMPANPSIAANDYIVVYNLGTGYAPGDAYDCSSQCNRAQVAATPTTNTVTLVSNPFATQSPELRSPNARFQVVPGGTQAVTYACSTGTAGNVVRHWNYGFVAAQPSPPIGGSSATLAGGATCLVDYTTAATGRNGLLAIALTLADASGESVTLSWQIHVDNSP